MSSQVGTAAKIGNYLRAGFPGVAIQTAEEARACDDVISAAKAVGKGLITWSATEGLRDLTELKPISETEDLSAACRHRRDETVYIFRDANTWPFERDPFLARCIRDMLSWAPTAGSCIVFVGSEMKTHPSFEKLVTVMDYTLPSPTDLRRIAAGIVESSGRECAISDDLIRALGGLSTSEAENALALSLVETQALEPAVVYREKVQSVRRTGLLEIVDPDPRGLDAIGGLDELKAWIIKRRLAYSPQAEAFGLPAPKGLLLVGVPGTGKSLSAKAIGTALGVPTVRLDIGALFNSLVGESEARTRDALKLAEAMSPCVLWVDEIDKGLAGAGAQGGGDSGVTRRVFGTIINWMQERRRPVFIVATANQVEGLPPELLRKGRFDEVFAVDLPNPVERSAILAIQLQRAGRDALVAQHSRALVRVVSSTDGFTGSEIETVVNEALFEAFARGGAEADITPDDLLAAAKAITPLAVTAKEQINGIREWAKNRARFASSREPLPTEAPGRRRISK